MDAVPHAIAGIIATLAEIQDYKIIEPRKPPQQTLSSEVRSRVEKIKSILAEYWDIFDKRRTAQIEHLGKFQDRNVKLYAEETSDFRPFYFYR